jgi:hypothetical protein
MMNVSKKITIMCIIITVICIIIIASNTIIKSYNADQEEQLEYGTNQRNELEQFDHEKRKQIEDEAEQYRKLQYELMLQTIEENSDYYISFSKRFLSEFEKFIYIEHNPFNFYLTLEDIYDRLDDEFNNDLLGKNCYIRQDVGITYVQLEYPDSIRVLDYAHSSIASYKYSEYWVIYIPDKYLNEEVIDSLSKEVFFKSLKNVKDNLFIAPQIVLEAH